MNSGKLFWPMGIQPTYEELKPIGNTFLFLLLCVSSLPMRN